MDLRSLDLSKFSAALCSLQAALDPPPRNDRERDGAIQRFEYTFELAWKSSARVLEAYGISATSPRAVFRELAAQGWVADPVVWFGFLDARNQTVHNYNEDVAEANYARVPEFYQHAIALYETLAEKVSG